MALHNSHRKTVAFYFEASPGATPADAAAWATAEGTDAFRHFVLVGGPEYILGDALVANADLQPEVFGVGDHHHGLPTADGGAIEMRLVGTSDSWTDDTQAVETDQGRLLEHALGGARRSFHGEVDTVTSQTEFTLSTTSIAVGDIIAFEDAGDPGKLYPAQVLTAPGAGVITIDRVMPFTVATSDKVYGAEMAYPEADALTNPADAAYTTLSLLYQVGPHCWMAGGAHLELSSIKLERGQQPVLVFAANAAKGYPQDAGAPSSPTWGDPISGSADVQAVGYGTRLFLQTQGTTTNVSLPVFSASLAVGVPVKPQDGVTESDDGSPGRVGYATEPADTILEIVVGLEAAHQTKWSAGTVLTATYFQVGPVGRSYAIHMHEATLMGPPELMLEQTNRYKLKLQARQDTDQTAEPLAAKLVIARY